jgi:hypothetical protein
MDRHGATTQAALHPFWRGAAGFAILVGAAMLVIWAYLLATGGVPELAVRPFDTWMHIGAEVLTALLLLAAGLALIARQSWARKAYLVAIGALLFTVIHAFAFYGERGDVAMVVFFVILAVFAIFFALRVEE